MEKCCKQCGVTLCDKNWMFQDIRKVNIYNRCKNCRNNTNYCHYKYESFELQKLVKKRAKAITARLCYIENVLKNSSIKRRKSYILGHPNKDNCIQCGVILCDKNRLKSKKGHILKKCTACLRNSKYCEYTYNTIELELLCKKNSRKIHYSLFKLKNPEIIKQLRKEWLEKGNNRKIQLEKSKQRSYKSRKLLDDFYIIKRLFRANKFKSNDIPQELIELKRAQLKLYREYYNKPNKL